jgi:hypothetical protein
MMINLPHLIDFLPAIIGFAAYYYLIVYRHWRERTASGLMLALAAALILAGAFCHVFTPLWGK